MPTKPFQIDTISLKRIADAVPAIIALYDITSGRYLYVNKAVTKMLGYTPEEFIEGGLEFAVGLVHSEDVEPTMKKNEEALANANKRSARSENEQIASFEYRMRDKDGDWHWLHTDGTVFQRSSKGNVRLVLNVSLDVTERRMAETHLKTSLKTLEEILSAA